ncbi:MAG: hypothetical protein J5656_02085 [Clostridia bacterium]|nr:hypothetical protein [Clostridia bacterium]
MDNNEIDEIFEDVARADLLRGMNDANDGKLVEEPLSSDYLRGYNAIKEALNTVAEKNKSAYQPGLDFIDRHGGLDALMDELEKREHRK